MKRTISLTVPRRELINMGLSYPPDPKSDGLIQFLVANGFDADRKFTCYYPQDERLVVFIQE